MSTIAGYSERRKRAELIGTLGAGVLGAGIGLLFAQVFARYTIGFVVVGLLSHAWGTYEKHRLDSSLGASTAVWIEWANWTCWMSLVGFTMYIVWGWL